MVAVHINLLKVCCLCLLVMYQLRFSADRGKIKGKVFTKDEVQAGPNFNLVKVHELVGA